MTKTAEELKKHCGKFFHDEDVSIVSCEDGWNGILMDFFFELSKIDKKHVSKVSQIKEKFGRIRIYLENIPEKIVQRVWDLEIKAEKKSSEICEVCGESGRLRTKHYWLKTLCDEHELNFWKDA